MNQTANPDLIQFHDHALLAHYIRLALQDRREEAAFALARIAEMDRRLELRNRAARPDLKRCPCAVPDPCYGDPANWCRSA